ncbi:anti-sigma factor family protein [Microbispora bryophytorum]|uniref:Zf-HC2 domain-containing protein n=1 Tax=Microbispora bryophytorum subsp. camponoti TaxID=1677852 RepID=A0ABR8LE66_9ACTN|nr:zf-HC2 domain-containing protein [Microbispora camponoti]MBD3147810.1 zf-HC2 domain-containing protein [Microbispora camponoti]
MTCEEVRISLGAYVLGALDAEETAEVEAHLDTCAACRAELAELSGLPPLLARVSAEDIERAAAPPRSVLDSVFADVLANALADAPADAADAPTVAADAPTVAASARRGRRSRVLLALAASVVVAAVGGTAWVSAAQRGSEGTAAGSIAAAPDQASRAAKGQAAPDQTAQDQTAQDQTAHDLAGRADKSAEAFGEPFAAQESPVASSAPSAAASDGVMARKADPSRAEATATAPATPSEARGSSGDARIVVRLVPHDGGTQVVARVAGVPAGTVGTWRAVAKDGTVSTLGSWTVGRGEYRGQKMVLEGSTALRPGQIDRIELVDTGGRVLVTARP